MTRPLPAPREARPPAAGAVVVFDLMGTLLHDPYRTAYAEAAGRTFEEFDRARSPALYDRFERGVIDEDEYWRGLRAAGVDLDVPRFHALRRGGYHWLDGMRSVLDGCCAVRRTVVGSNYPVWIKDVLPLLPDRVAGVFASCDLGARKPDPRFYLRLARRVGCSPADLVLVDDKPENVRALREMGGEGIHHVSAGNTIMALEMIFDFPE
ncbi:HAD-IA family hydrolase [Actinoplanes rectilineatus]|uniref:HAD-IA family hydrolase n=1 Tax=Actinoplanes rectilineatus TaxID=113571 RepID=UPI000696E14D|nr:HAD-IA family hydrolase [Actinoplanes rectilineatus]